MLIHPVSSKRKHTQGLFYWWQAVLLAIIVATNPAHALDPARAPQQFALDEWTLESDAPARAIAQDSEGYLWIATPMGLVRFDGFTFTTYVAGKIPELNSNSITALGLATDGTLWIGTENNGITCYKQGRWTEHMLPREAMVSPVRCFYFETDGSVLIGLTEQVWRYRDGAFSQLSLPEERRPAGIRQMVRSGKDDLWIVGVRILEVLGETATRLTQKEGLPHSRGQAVVLAPEGGVWIGTPSGAARFDKGATVSTLTTSAIEAMLVDRDRTLWIATANGLVRYSKGRCEPFLTRTGEQLSNLSCLFEDREGNIWIGGSGGIARLKNVKVTMFSRREGLVGEAISVLETSDGTRWVGTRGGGLWKMKDNRTEVLSRREGLPEDTISVLAEAPDGGLWIAQPGGALGVWREGSYHPIPLKDEAGRVRTIVVDHDGVVWVGFVGKGLKRYTDGKLVEIPLDGLGRGIRMLFVDHRNRLWVGGKQGCLGVLEEGRWNLLIPPTGEDARVGISGICEDEQGAIWLTSDEAPILRQIRDHKITNVPLTIKDLGQLFSAIIEKDDLWVTSSRGIQRIPLSWCRKAMAGGKEAASFELIDEQDGLRMGRPTFGGWPTCYRMKDGKLWFALRTGIAVVDEPAREEALPPPPKVFIEQVHVDGAPVDVASELRMPAGTRRIAIRYSGLVLGARDRLRFRYQLAGFDDKEVDAGSDRTVLYTGLQPGRYVFRVRALRERGVASERPVELAFSIEPYFWQTRWFLLGIALAVVGAIITADRLRHRAARLREAELHRRVEEEMAKVKVLTGLLPTCAWCKKIRKDDGSWQQIEEYVTQHSTAKFTHGMCPECQARMMREGGLI